MIGETVLFGENIDLKYSSTTEYIWNVENFPELTNSESCKFSIFPGDSKSYDKWKLQISLLKGYKVKPVCVGLYLLESTSINGVNATYEFNFLDANNKVIIAEAPQTSEFSLRVGHIALFPYKKFVDLASSLLINGSTLKIHCKIVTQKTSNLKDQCDKQDDFLVKKPFQLFFLNEKFADVVIKNENTSFPASKLILAAHSPVFNAMFSSEMRETTENIVKMDDCSDEAVKGLLEFMYTGEIQFLEENAIELLKISDKYQVMDLKKKVESVLMGKLGNGNAVDLLILAHLHSPATLKPKVVAFVNLFSKDIHTTEAFKQMTQDFPELVRELNAAAPN